MKPNQKLIAATVATAAALLITGTAAAQEIELEGRLTVTFSGPVEIPGEVLPAGTYVFEMLKGGSLTRILSSNELHIYATLLTVPEEQQEPSGDGAVILHKNDQGGPARVDAWFVPGDPVGSEFVYKKEGHKSVESAVDSSGKKVSHATEKGFKDVGESAEHLGMHAAHAGEDVGKGVYHAGKYLVT
jgi:hypothetical protein